MTVPDENATGLVRELLQVPEDKRGREWQQRFDRLVLNAALYAAAQQFVQRSDGFLYLAVQTVHDSTSTIPTTLAAMLPHATDQGLGVVLDNTPDAPAWLWSYGQLWSQREYGSFLGEVHDAPDNAPVHPTVLREKGIHMASAPDDKFLPIYARRVLHAYLHLTLGLKDPRVIVLFNPEERPSRKLAFNVHLEQFESSERFDAVMQALRWYLPPRRALVALPIDSPFADSFVPLQRVSTAPPPI